MVERALATLSFPSGVIRIAEASVDLDSNRYGNIFMGSRRAGRLGGRPDQTVHCRRRRRYEDGRWHLASYINGWRWRTQPAASLAIHYWAILLFKYKVLQYGGLSDRFSQSALCLLVSLWDVFSHKDHPHLFLRGCAKAICQCRPL